MAWLRFSDDHNRKPEIRALDDAGYRALACLIEAAEHFNGCGMVPDDYALTAYPHARQKLRREVRKLADRGLVHLLTGTDDHDPNCASCQTRLEELAVEGGEELRKNPPASSAPSSQSRKTEPMHICVRSFFDVAMTPEAKREKRRKDAERQQRKRDRDKAAPSRRDAEPPSRPPVPVPVPQLKINDHGSLSEEPELPSTANPSTPSSGTADLDAGLWLRKEYESRWQQTYPGKPLIRWNGEQLGHFDELVRKAAEEPNPDAIRKAAFDGFFADDSQRKYRHVPQGLLMFWDRYVGPCRAQIRVAASEEKQARLEARYQADLQRESDKQTAKVLAKQKAGNSAVPAAVPGNNLGITLEDWSGPRGQG